MNLVEIGKFISELRKEKALTQEQLGEQIGVTNKTISRWETGAYLPPADAMIKMSELFGVSLTELFSGKRLSAEEYKEAAEETIKSTYRTSSFNLKDKIAFFKKKWLKEHIALLICYGVIVLALLIAGILMKNIFLCISSVIALLIFHGIRNNQMMAYVERNAFEETK